MSEFGAGGIGLAVLVLAAIGSAMLTASTIRFALRRSMLDMPGRRRSHAMPTPRGGGIAIVIVVIAGLSIAVLAGSRWDRSSLQAGAVMLALLLVATVGWLDDRRGLAASARFFVHVAAAVIIVLAMPQLLDPGFWGGGMGLPVVALPIGFGLVLACVWSINLHNFMDGINGHLAWQAVFTMLALLAVVMPQAPEIGWFALLVAGATLGFLPFNFPRARIFLGDVGSGSLGLLIAVVPLALLAARQISLCQVLLVGSAFVMDATATLLSRWASGRRWYSAHREHLYQWLVRSGVSHAAVVGRFQLWNVLVVVPALVLTAWSRDSVASGEFDVTGNLSDWLIVAIVYSAALALWIAGKRRCIAVVRTRRRHGVA